MSSNIDQQIKYVINNRDIPQIDIKKSLSETLQCKENKRSSKLQYMNIGIRRVAVMPLIVLLSITVAFAANTILRNSKITVKDDSNVSITDWTGAKEWRVDLKDTSLDYDTLVASSSNYYLKLKEFCEAQPLKKGQAIVAAIKTNNVQMPWKYYTHFESDVFDDRDAFLTSIQDNYRLVELLKAVPSKYEFVKAEIKYDEPDYDYYELITKPKSSDTEILYEYIDRGDKPIRFKMEFSHGLHIKYDEVGTWVTYHGEEFEDLEYNPLEIIALSDTDALLVRSSNVQNFHAVFRSSGIIINSSPTETTRDELIDIMKDIESIMR